MFFNFQDPYMTNGRCFLILEYLNELNKHLLFHLFQDEDILVIKIVNQYKVMRENWTNIQGLNIVVYRNSHQNYE